MPLLYASFVSSATSYGFRPLQLFHRTICNPSPPIGFEIRLASCLLYVENRLSDYLGNSLYEDTESDDALPMITQYFRLLADIVNHAPNLRHLNVVSLETREISFWRHILPDDANPRVDAVLPKLQSLSSQFHAKVQAHDRHEAGFRRICSAMTAVTMLTDLRVSGFMADRATLPTIGMFKWIERLEITECVLSYEDISELWAACNGLRHITCEWAFLDCAYDMSSHLYTALERHATTLETLYLDTGEVRMPPPPKLYSLRPFTSLRSLSICETALGVSWFIIDNEEPLQCRLSELLPGGLEHLTLCMHSIYVPMDDHPLDMVPDLWDLADDVRQCLPGLRVFRIQSDESKFGAPRLAKAFENVGVHLDLANEMTT